MKTYLTLFIICLTINAEADSWVQKANSPVLRVFCFSFSIGNKGYVGTGHDNTGIYTNDFWEYDPIANSWTQKANFGGSGRERAIGFSIANKGYAGLGDNNGFGYQDFWEYEALNNIWNQKGDFLGGTRNAAVSFSIGNMGYICTGYNSTGVTNDLWQYDPLSDTWLQKTSLPGAARGESNGFVIGNNGYIVAGYNATGVNGLFSDLWEYNSIADTWSQKANFPSAPRCDASAFAIGNKGYFGTGDHVFGATFSDFWEYDPVADTWTQKANYGGGATDEAAYFSIGNNGYIGLGDDVNPSHEFWEYTPDSTTGIEELSISDFTIYPNPAKGEFTVYGLQFTVYKNFGIKVFDSNGKIVLNKQITNNNKPQTVNCKQLTTGIYFLQLSEGEKREVRKVVVE